MKRQHRKDLNIPMILASILFCLTLVSMHLMSGLYAKYTSYASGSDSARVISFGELTLTETGDFYQDNKLMIIPGVDLTKKVVVDFAGSEAATYVFVEVIAEGWETADNDSFSMVSDGKVLMQWSIANGWSYLKKDDNTHIYYRTLSPNTELDEVDVIDNNGNITVNEYITKSEMQELTNVSIKFRATVVQAGGFANPEDAWNSVATKERSGNE